MNMREREEELTLEILRAIEARSDVTQRHLARSAGVALGLANAYLKRCVRKGLVKIHQAPANRYLYYLTPKGFAEKSRLTAEYLSYSLRFVRTAGDSCLEILDSCAERHWCRVMLAGCSELAEIAHLRSMEHAVDLVGVFDPTFEQTRFLNLPCISSPSAALAADAWIVTDLVDPRQMAARLLEEGVAPERVLVPPILGFSAESLLQNELE